MKKENNGKTANKKPIKAKTNNTKGKVSSVDTTSVTERVKPSSGRGLANEGTIVSYEEER